MGTSHSRACNDITEQIWLFWLSRSLWISAAFIPGKENVIVDQELRHINTDMEWKLNSDILIKALETLNFKPEIDLCASRNNCQLKAYASYRPDPEAKFVDCFPYLGQVFTFTISLLSVLLLE